MTDDDIAWANTVALVRAFEPPALAVLEKANKENADKAKAKLEAEGAKVTLK